MPHEPPRRASDNNFSRRSAPEAEPNALLPGCRRSTRNCHISKRRLIRRNQIGHASSAVQATNPYSLRGEPARATYCAGARQSRTFKTRKARRIVVTQLNEHANPAIVKVSYRASAVPIVRHSRNGECENPASAFAQKSACTRG